LATPWPIRAAPRRTSRATPIATRPRSWPSPASSPAAGDKKLEAEGKMQKAKGAARDVLGDVKDAARRANKDTRKEMRDKH
jgi:hypothetical protein